MKANEMMITEDYCSYELSKLLKEKGFDEPVETVIYSNGEWAFIDTRSVSRTLHTMLRNSELNIYDDCVSMPTHQLACKWLREVKDIDIVIMPLFRFKGGKIYCYEIHSDDIDVREGRFDTYEEAVEAAIKFSLENLI